jgi:hypothetical protein
VPHQSTLSQFSMTMALKCKPQTPWLLDTMRNTRVLWFCTLCWSRQRRCEAAFEAGGVACVDQSRTLMTSTAKFWGGVKIGFKDPTLPRRATKGKEGLALFLLFAWRPALLVRDRFALLFYSTNHLTFLFYSTNHHVKCRVERGGGDRCGQGC